MFLNERLDHANFTNHNSNVWALWISTSLKIRISNSCLCFLVIVGVTYLVNLSCVRVSFDKVFDGSCFNLFRWNVIIVSKLVVHGALRCLALLSGDLDDTMVPTLVPVLFPCLHTIVSSPQVSIWFII